MTVEKIDDKKMGLAGLIVPSENGTSWPLVTWSNKKESIVEKVDDS